MSPPPINDEDRLQAGEYVLGTLPHAERLTLARRMQAEPDLARAVEDWQNLLSPLNAEYGEVQPPPDLLRRIEARLFARPPSPWRRYLGVLSGIGAAGALALMLLAVLPQRVQGPELLATLGAADAALRFELRHDGRQILLQQVAGTPAPAGQSYEVWAIAPEAAPVSLGLLGEDGLAVEYPRPPAGWVLAVSAEPAGGSPTGAPTGPVIAAAELAADNGG